MPPSLVSFNSFPVHLVFLLVQMYVHEERCIYLGIDINVLSYVPTCKNLSMSFGFDVFMRVCNKFSFLRRESCVLRGQVHIFWPRARTMVVKANQVEQNDVEYVCMCYIDDRPLRVFCKSMRLVALATDHKCERMISKELRISF